MKRCLIFLFLLLITNFSFGQYELDFVIGADRNKILQLNSVSDLTLDQNGDLHILDGGSFTVHVIQLADNSIQRRYGRYFQLDYSNGLAIDKDGYSYITVTNGTPTVVIYDGNGN